MKPKKSLGQNFLTSVPALKKIVDAAEIKSGEKILEVGPGKGNLTELLLKTDASVFAVEKDHRLIPELQNKFSKEIEEGKLTLIETDILDFDQNSFFNGEYKIVANIPYYITGQLLRKFLSAEKQPKIMVLLLQKEVVTRIIATDKKESLLSLSIKAYGTPKKVGDVNRGSFFPTPNVDSAIISIKNISKNFFDSISEENFFKVINQGFSHKRKKLLNNLSEIYEKEKVLKIFGEIGLDKNIRAEDLKLEAWKEITQKL